MLEGQVIKPGPGQLLNIAGHPYQGSCADTGQGLLLTVDGTKRKTAVSTVLDRLIWTRPPASLPYRRLTGCGLYNADIVPWAGEIIEPCGNHEELLEMKGTIFRTVYRHERTGILP